MLIKNKFINRIYFFVSLLSTMLMLSYPDLHHILNSIFLSIIFYTLIYFINKKILKYNFKYKISEMKYKNLTIVLCIALVVYFYNNYINDKHYFYIISNMLNISLKMLIIISAIILSIFSYLFIILLINFLSTYLDFHYFFNKIKEFRKPIIILFIVYFVSFISILRANYYFCDDNYRIATGYNEYFNASRYLNYLLAPIFHTSRFLNILSPLNQILSVLIMSICSVILLYVVYNKKSFSLIEYISVIPFGVCPYILTLESYNYESIFMVLSILFSIIPILFIHLNYSYEKIIISIFVFTLSMCLTYQASSGFFPIILIFYMIYDYLINKKDANNIIKIVLFSAISYLFGLLFYKTIMYVNLSGGYYDTSLGTLNIFLNNYRKYFIILLNDFNIVWLLIIVLLSIFFIIFYIIKTNRNKFFSFVIVLFSLVLSFLLMFGAYLFIKKALFQARAMYGVGIVLALICMYLCKLNSKTNISYLPIFAISWCFYTFAFSYGNLLSIQKEFTEKKMNMIVDDLNEINAQTKTVVFNGSSGLSPVLKEYSKYFPIIKTMFIDTEISSTSLPKQRLIYFYEIGYSFRNIDFSGKIEGTELYKKTIYYNILFNDKYIIIDFN